MVFFYLVTKILDVTHRSRHKFNVAFQNKHFKTCFFMKNLLNHLDFKIVWSMMYWLGGGGGGGVASKLDRLPDQSMIH